MVEHFRITFGDPSGKRQTNVTECPTAAANISVSNHNLDLFSIEVVSHGVPCVNIIEIPFLSSTASIS